MGTEGVPLAFCWPLIHLAVFVARFGGLPLIVGTVGGYVGGRVWRA